jgi:hypothetical protein
VNFPEFCNFNFEELRNWVSFVFLVVGGGIAIRTFILNQRQRKLENSFRLIELCNKSLSSEDLLSWHLIHVASSESSGAKKGFFVDEKKTQVPFSQLFLSKEFIARDSIERFCELFNLVGYEYLKGTVDIRLFYFEYGQYLKITHYWISSVDDDSRFFKSRYPYFYKMFQKSNEAFAKLPYKTISHLDQQNVP